VARFLLDEMLTAVIAAQLEVHGHDAQAIHSRPELRGIPDDQVLERAADASRIVVTTNIDDFVSLDRLWRQTGRAHSGIVLISNSAFPQNNSFIGAIVTGLCCAAQTGDLPGSGELKFLARGA